MSVTLTAKEAAKKKLIKDLVICIVTAVIAFLVFIIGGWFGCVDGFRDMILENGVFTGIILTLFMPILMGIYISGLVIGWRYWHRRIMITTWLSLIIKLCLATLTGYIVFPITIIKDIIAYVKA